MRRPLLLLSAALIVACSADVVSAPKLVVSLSGPTSVAGVRTPAPGYAALECSYLLTATASLGTPNDIVAWHGGHSTVVGQDGSTYSSPINNAAAFVGGAPELPVGRTARGQNTAYWMMPFQYTLVLYYSTQETKLDSASYTMACQ